MTLSSNAFAPSLTSISSISPFYRRTPEFVIDDPDLHHLAKYLFIVVAQAVNLHTNRVQMTVEQLAKRTGYSISTVLRLLPSLEAKGLISIDRAGKGTKIPNIYHLAGEAARMILSPSAGQSSANQLSERQSSPAVDRPALPDDSQPDSRSTVTETPVSPERPSASQLTKQEALKELNQREAVVVDPPIFSLKDVSASTMQSWIDTYGETRVWQVLQALPKQKNVGCPPGWVQSALKNNWQFGRAHHEPEGDREDGLKYITGEDAAFIRH